MIHTNSILDNEPEYIYVMLQDHGRHYIGKTGDVQSRFRAHESGNGAAWTTIFKPVSISEHFIAGPLFIEEDKTKEYMIKYGIYKVRGGPYVAPVLEDDVVKALRIQIWHALKRCFKCGGDHFVSKCKENDVKGYCCRCGRDHWASTCTELFDIDGLPIPDGLVRR